MTDTPEDDDQTVIGPVSRPTSAPAPQAPTSAAEPAEPPHELPRGTHLGEFELTEKIGEGGFSIVYAAWDHSLERKVAVKEYMPYSIAARKARSQVIPRSEKHRDTFEAGLRSFINEAKLLAQFDHPSLVKVFRFWEANGTAYMVMPFYEGTTLKDTVRALSHPPDEAWLLAVLAPLTEALKVIHGEHCYHRDIAPDNVMLLAETGGPLLLDFGAARRVIGDMTQALTVILKSGYAPVEQYAEVPNMKQGAWTDIYALAATVHWVITGAIPPAAVGRMLNDSYLPLVKRAQGRYSERFLQAIDRALAIKPENRTQTIEAFQQDIGLIASVAQPPTQAASASRIKGSVLASIAALIVGGAGWAAWTHWPRAVPATPAATAIPAPRPTLQPKPESKAPTRTEPLVPPPPQPPTALKPSPTPPPALKTSPKPQSPNQDQPSKHRAECADILQRISLGDTSPDLMARLDQLHCK